MSASDASDRASSFVSTGLKAELRRAKGTDVAHILDVEAQAGRSLPDPARLAAAIDDDARLVVVACARGTSGVGGLLGWGKTHFWGYDDGAAPRGHYLGGITVRPDCRRRGIATALTQARVDWIWQHAPEAWYVVNASNLASTELHRRWGFVEVARASSFHTTTFDGGVGILMRAARQKLPK